MQFKTTITTTILNHRGEELVSVSTTENHTDGDNPSFVRTVVDDLIDGRLSDRHVESVVAGVRGAK